MRKIFNGRAENGKFNLRNALNRSRRNDDGSHNGRRFHLSMREHRDGAFVACLVRVLVNQLMQRGTRRHRVQQQDHPNQQRRERRFAVINVSSPVFHLNALTGFKLSDNDGHCKSGQQCRGQLEPVVRVELQFGKQIGAGDAEKRPGAKRQRVTE